MIYFSDLLDNQMKKKPEIIVGFVMVHDETPGILCQLMNNWRSLMLLSKRITLLVHTSIFA